MPADLSWIDGSVEDAAKLIADRAVATRALGGGVAPGEKPAWALDLEKAAAAAEAAEKQAAGLGETLGETLGGYWNQAQNWLGTQVRSAVGDQVSGAVRDTLDSPGVRGALTGGLIGAGGGAALGLGANLLSSNKRKRPLSNALFGGLLGGLGGAAAGGLYGTIGGPDTAAPPGDRLHRDEVISARNAAMRDAGNVDLEKTWAGVNRLGAAGLARGAGYGAALGTVPEMAGRAAVRAFNPTTARQTLNPNSVRTFLSSAQQTGLAGLGRRPDTAAVRAAVGGSFDPIRTRFRTSGNPVLASMHGATEPAIARALTRGASAVVPVTPAYRPALFTRGVGVRGAVGALAGTVFAGARNGVNQATGPEARARYLAESAEDLRTRFPHIGADATADPAGAALRAELAAAADRLRGAGPANPLTPEETNRFTTLFMGGGQGQLARSLHDRFREIEEQQMRAGGR